MEKFDGVEHTMIESITSMYINDTKGVTFNNKTKYVQFYETNKLNESRMQSEALARGLQRMVPSQLLRLFTPYEFQKMVCGKETIDLDLLKKHTIFGDKVNPSAKHIQYFWNVLSSFTQKDLYNLPMHKEDCHRLI